MNMAVKRGGIIGMAVLVALCIVAGAWLLRFPSVQALIAQATSRQPDRFSELYFTDYRKLPKNIEVGKDYEASFTVVSHEAQKKMYTYQVKIVEGKTERLLPPINFTLSDSDSLERKLTFRAERPDDTVEVIVNLLSSNQAIHFTARSWQNL